MASAKHPGTIERRGDSYRVTLHVGGHRRRFTIRTDDPREAVEFAKRKDQELERERVRSRAGEVIGIRCSQLFSRFDVDHVATLKPKTQEVYRRGLAAFRAFLVDLKRDPQLEKVNKGTIKEFLLWRRTFQREGREPVSNRSVQKDRTILHTVFEMAVSLDWIESNPVDSTRGPKVTTPDYVIISESQFAALARETAGNPMLQLYALVLGEAGLRALTEALWLRWEDIDLEGGTLAVVSGRDGHTTKTGKGRLVPMSLPLRSAMREHFARFRFATYQGQRSPWVFHHEIGRCHFTAGARIERMDRGLKAAAKRAGIPAEWRLHDLRHRRCSLWFEQGVNVVDIMAAMGHNSLQTTNRYTHLLGGHTQRMADLEARQSDRPISRPKVG